MFSFFKQFNREKLLLSFEYGVLLSEVAQQHKVELTPEIMERAEKMIEDEFKDNNATHLAVMAMPLILSIFETDMSK